MDQGGTTWIVTADAREARIFEERLRSGSLREITALRMRAQDADRHSGRQRATVHQRVGQGRHGAGQEAPRRADEAHFLGQVAAALAERCCRGEFDRLVLMAPPHALGALRAALPPTLQDRIEASDPHERRDDDAEALRRHLRAARARSGT